MRVVEFVRFTPEAKAALAELKITESEIAEAERRATMAAVKVAGAFLGEKQWIRLQRQAKAKEDFENHKLKTGGQGA